MSQITGIDPSCFKYIIKNQIFATKIVNSVNYINRHDVERFNHEFIMICRVAAEHSLSPKRLMLQSQKYKIQLFYLERINGLLQSYIKRSDLQKLLSIYFD